MTDSSATRERRRHRVVDPVHRRAAALLQVVVVLGLRELVPGRNRGTLSQGVQEGRQAFRIPRIHGEEVHRKRPRGVQVNPLNPVSVSPCHIEHAHL